MNYNRQNDLLGPEGRRDDLSFFHQKRVIIPTSILGLALTVLSWFVPPSKLFSAFPPFLSSYLFTFFCFVPPFLAVYALGHLLYPKTEEEPDVEAGFMSGYRYREKSTKRWQIIVVAGVIAALNYFLVSMYWEGRG